MPMATKGVVMRLPEELVDEVDGLIDRVTYRSRTHFFEVAVREKLAQIQENSELGFA